MRFATRTEDGDDDLAFVSHSVEPDGDEVRIETLRGREWLVAPVVLVREGVLNGGFLPFDEIKASVPGWNGRPITVPPAEGTEAATLAPDGRTSGHPIETNDAGEPEFVSANRRPFIEDMVSGHVQNVEARDDLPDDDGQMSARGLVGEAWLDVELLADMGEDAQAVVKRVAQGNTLDVSTGYFHRPIGRQGRHDGEQYERVQTDVMPDHLAMLPNETGACSWPDGCGVPRDPTANGVSDSVAAVANAAGVSPSVLVADGGTTHETMSRQTPAANAVDTIRRALGIESGDDADSCSCGHHAGNAVDVSSGDLVRWESSGGTAYGEVVEVRESEDAEPFGDEISGDAGPIGPPAALIAVYRPDGGEWEETDTRVAHRTDTDTLTKIESFPEANRATESSTNTTMKGDYDPEALAERTEFEAETLREWDESNLAALAETVEANDDGGDGDGGSDGDGGTATGNNDDGGNDDGDVREELDALRSEVEALRDERDAARREQILAHSELDEDDLDALTDEGVALETLADRLVPDDPAQAAQANAGPQGNRANYVAQGGAQAPTGGDEPDADEYAANVGALAAAEQAEQSGGD